MDVDKRRDHSLRVPRPDLSVELGTPNACSGCHVKDQLASIDQEKQPRLLEYADWLEAAEAGDEQIADAIKKTDAWCDAACEKWYGENRKQPKHFSEAIVAFRRGEPGAVNDLLRVATQPEELTPVLARASALGELAAAGVGNVTAKASKLVNDTDEHPIVRAAAIGLFMGASPNVVRRSLMRHVDDESRLVRIEAARLLVASGVYPSMSSNERLRVDNALAEVKDSLMVASDRAGAHMGWAMLCEGRGRYQDAIEAYETAIRTEPNMTGPRTNLASMLERVLQQSGPQQREALMQRIEQLRNEELPLIARDAALAPENAGIQYRYGLALYLAGKIDQALEQLELAVKLAPDVADFRQARDLLMQRINQDSQQNSPSSQQNSPSSQQNSPAPQTNPAGVKSGSD